MRSQHRRALALGIALLVLGAALLVLGAGVGSTGFESLFAAWRDPVALQIVRDIRLPRTLGAWLAGALLGFAGAVAQGLFRNPLADPYLLGSASGASLGVAAALWMFGASPASTQWVVRLGMTGAAFLGAVVAVMFTLLLARGVQRLLQRDADDQGSFYALTQSNYKGLEHELGPGNDFENEFQFQLY